jgi:rare lipoprotein A
LSFTDENMSQLKFWKPIAASLAIVTLGTATPAVSQEAVPSSGAQPLVDAAQVLDGQVLDGADLSSDAAAIAVAPGAVRPAASSITELYEHQISGRDAVTLYVRNIPIATFVTPQDSEASSRNPTTAATALVGQVEVSDRPRACADVVRSEAPASASAATSCATSESSARMRAIAAAERINQFYRAGQDATNIRLEWNAADTNYQIKADDAELLIVDASVTGAESSPTLSDEALQVTNRLRRQIGNAPPLTYEGPRRTRTVAFGGGAAVETAAVSNVAVRSTAEGYASWYGPGFHGRRTASGEVFNQNAMTAAHRTLPFGTRVRVVNLNNGQSTVVRITDRGPFIHNRIVDLSAGAARAVGLYSAGVGRVRIEILGQ